MLNHELSVLLHLDEAGVNAYDIKLTYILEKAAKLTQKDIDAGQKVRDLRANSVPASERYRTAKRFSIATSRQRSLSRGPGVAEAKDDEECIQH